MLNLHPKIGAPPFGLSWNAFSTAKKTRLAWCQAAVSGPFSGFHTFVSGHSERRYEVSDAPFWGVSSSGFCNRHASPQNSWFFRMEIHARGPPAAAHGLRRPVGVLNLGRPPGSVSLLPRLNHYITNTLKRGNDEMGCFSSTY